MTRPAIRIRRQKAHTGLPCAHDEHYQGGLRGAVDPGEMARDACMPGLRKRSGCAYQNNHRAMESVAMSGLPQALCGHDRYRDPRDQAAARVLDRSCRAGIARDRPDFPDARCFAVDSAQDFRPAPSGARWRSRGASPVPSAESAGVGARPESMATRSSTSDAACRGQPPRRVEPRRQGDPECSTRPAVRCHRGQAGPPVGAVLLADPSMPRRSCGPRLGRAGTEDRADRLRAEAGDPVDSVVVRRLHAGAGLSPRPPDHPAHGHGRPRPTQILEVLLVRRRR